MDEPPILILGAGPSGMAAGMELFKSGKSFEVVERNSAVGGLARTLAFGEFRTDIGPHRFFSKNPYLYTFIHELLGEKWVRVKRYTRFYAHGKLFKYPNDAVEILTGFGTANLVRAIGDYTHEKIRSIVHPRKISSFEEYAIAQFGRSLAEVNILNYTEKVWGIPASQISVEWAKQRIKGLSIGQMIQRSFLQKSTAKSLVDEFYYPDSGTGLIYETIREKISKKATVHLNTRPIAITCEGKRITSVALQNSEGEITTKKPSMVVSSIPITELTRLLVPQPPEEVLNAVQKLTYRSQVYLFITVNKPHISPDQWIYFPQKEIPFGRISEMKNFSEKMSPLEKTSLLIEFFCWEGDETWCASKEELLARAVEWLEKLNFVTKSEIGESFLHRQANVYPVYEIGYEKNLDIVKNYLNQIENLEYIGRPGRFKYTNQDHSLEMGILAARSIIHGKKYNLDEVGGENEYFEKGSVQGI